MIRILHLTTGVSNQSAVYRLHDALKINGVESYIYAGLQTSIIEEKIITNKNSLKLKILAKFEKLTLKLYPNRKMSPWDLGFFDNSVDEIIKRTNPDIIHLHWINQFISIKKISKFKLPIVWTMHDSWTFTGGCHIPYPCDKYLINCELCPQLASNKKLDLSNFVFNFKLKYWQNINLNIIGPSKWITDCARNSLILRNKQIYNIPNSINTDFYKPLDSVESRVFLKLPLYKKLVLFGANNAMNDKNKGYNFVIEAFQLLKTKYIDIELVIFGNKSVFFDEINKIRSIGVISNPEIFPIVYSACDVTVNASISENFSNIILESLSCGTPVAAFDIGGNSDFNIYNDCISLAKPFDIKSLANCITKQLNKDNNRVEMSKKINEEFGYSKIADRHKLIYKTILENMI